LGWLFFSYRIFPVIVFFAVLTANPINEANLSPRHLFFPNENSKIQQAPILVFQVVFPLSLSYLPLWQDNHPDFFMDRRVQIKTFFLKKHFTFYTTN